MLKYGLRCTLQWEFFLIDVTLPALWSDVDSAKRVNLSFYLSEASIKCKDGSTVIATIPSDEWWNYRISALKHEHMVQLMKDISHYEPKSCSLADFLPYKDNINNLTLKPYELEYLSYQVYIAE